VRFVKEHTILAPKTENPPAKVKDAGVVSLVKKGAAAYNAKSGELLLLPEGALELGQIKNSVREAAQQSGFQRVDCGSDDAVFSIAERYVREWRETATAFCDERSRELRVLSWHEDESSAALAAEDLMKTILDALSDEDETPRARFSFVEDVPEDKSRIFVLASACETGDIGAKAGFLCRSCGSMKFPDSPLGYIPSQPGENEPEEAIKDIATPGANTIAELCAQLNIDVNRTLKAMLYVAYETGETKRAVASFVRGDYNMSMNKLARWLERELKLTGLRSAGKPELQELIGEVAGYCGPVGMPPGTVLVCDSSVIGSKNTVAGANRPGYHKIGCCHPRDFNPPTADIAQATAGTPCACGGVYEPHAIREAGHLRIFNAASDGGAPVKTLSYRDREGSHEYPAICAGTISAERIMLSVHS
jgi:prolyl-tRNA synthetase